VRLEEKESDLTQRTQSQKHRERREESFALVFGVEMPELPEVETLARGLQREIAGRRVLSVELGKTDFMDNPAEIERELPGRWCRGR
jgi:hypothetical protein